MLLPAFAAQHSTAAIHSAKERIARMSAEEVFSWYPDFGSDGVGWRSSAHIDLAHHYQIAGVFVWRLAARIQLCGRRSAYPDEKML